jgi:CRP/FNR family transcriptional regulator, cyclic AMP receptor protein
MVVSEPSTSFWSALEPGDADELTAACSIRTFEPGEVVFYEKQVPDSVLILRTGWVKVVVTAGDGRQAVLAFRGPGELVGELAALDDQPRGATVSAIKPVDALTLPSDAFRAFVEAHASVGVVLLRHISGRLRDADAKRIEFLEYGTGQRVASRLIELADLFGDKVNDAIRLPLTQDELAGATYASLESVGRALQRMRRLGCIDTRRREIWIVDRAKVERMSRGLVL